MTFKGWHGLRLDTSPTGLQRRTSLDVMVTPSGLLSETNFDVMCSVCGTGNAHGVVYYMTWVAPYGLRSICSDCCRGCKAPKRETCKPGQKDSVATGTVSSMRPSKSSETTSSH